VAAKMLPTKALQQVPVEFERVFIEHGWNRANYLFGKRATTRYYLHLGPERLRAARDEYVRAQQVAKKEKEQPKWVAAHYRR
jgi:hypothetical protein